MLDRGSPRFETDRPLIYGALVAIDVASSRYIAWCFALAYRYHPISSTRVQLNNSTPICLRGTNTTNSLR